jgi:hypothetical protein
MCLPEETEHLVPAPREAGLPFDLDKLTIIGPAKLTYAHFCGQALPDPVFPTLTRIRRLVKIGADGKFPEGSTLIFQVEERGPVVPKRQLYVLFAGQHEEGICQPVNYEFAVLGPTSPRVAKVTLDVGQLNLHGPGPYSFEFVLGDQHLGGLSLLAYQDTVSEARLKPVPFRREGMRLDFGHIVEEVEFPDPSDPEIAVTLRRVMEVLPLRESAPFTLDPGVLLLGLSAPEGFPRDHVLDIEARRTDGTPLGNGRANITLEPAPFGELIFFQAMALAGRTVFPGEGDYEFLVKVDGKVLGIVRLFARVV